MNATRVLAYLLAGVASVLSLLAYMNYIYMLGFPDGFITELSYAYRNLAYIFIGVSVMLSVYCIYLGTVALRKKVASPLSGAVVLYSLFIAVVLLVGVYYRSRLTGGSGG